MLTLKIRLNHDRPERIFLTLEDGREIAVSLLDATRGSASLGIDAPKSIRIDREKVKVRRDLANMRKGGQAT